MLFSASHVIYQQQERYVDLFLSYTARLGCSRCLKEFTGRVGERRDFSGFDRSKWTPRDGHLETIESTEIMLTSYGTVQLNLLLKKLNLRMAVGTVFYWIYCTLVPHGS